MPDLSLSDATSIFILMTGIPALLVIWSHIDWGYRARWSATIAVTVGILLAGLISVLFVPVPILVFAIYDVATRPNLAGVPTSVWIAAILLIPGLGVLAYFIWALLPSNRPQVSAATSPPAP